MTRYSIFRPIFEVIDGERITVDFTDSYEHTYDDFTATRHDDAEAVAFMDSIVADKSAHEALRALADRIDPPQLLSLADIRNGTGFPKDARFVQVQP